MILGSVFEQFAAASPVTVMARAALENALPPSTVDCLFEEVADRQYTRTLLFSDVVDLMGAVVCKIHPSVSAAFKKRAATLGVTRKAVYSKINGLEPAIAAALVRRTAAAVAPVIEEMGARAEPWLKGRRVRILDGSHLGGSEHRLKPLRTEGAGALPGQALVIFDPELSLVVDVIPCEDGHAQERSMTADVLKIVTAGDLWIGDRNFCTTAILFGIAGREASFVIRQHGRMPGGEDVGERVEKGRCETGTVFEQSRQLAGLDGEPLTVRRITIELDKKTRDGDEMIHIFTNLPAAAADAVAIAELYRRRWRIETAFQEMEATLNGEIDALGYPRAALFALCVALVAYNMMSVVKGALRSVHGNEAAEEISGWYLAEEIGATTRGMMLMLPEDEWTVFHNLTPAEMAAVLKSLARQVRLSEYRKQRRGPKKPKPLRTSGKDKRHISTARLLKDQQKPR